jgi:hypothetical protein
MVRKYIQREQLLMAAPIDRPEKENKARVRQIGRSVRIEIDHPGMGVSIPEKEMPNWDEIFG